MHNCGSMVMFCSRHRLRWQSWCCPYLTQFTAHPKFDAKTGELHFLGYDITKPEVKLRTLDRKGNLQHTLKVRKCFSTI